MPRVESIAESAKERSLRVPLDHYERPDLLARAKWKLSALVAAVAAMYIGWVLLGGRSGQEQASPGRLAAAHAGWNNDCLACHQNFQPLRSDAVSLAGLISGRAEHREALDASCIKCHDTPVHHAAAKPEEVPSCAACHRDHQGLAAHIVRPADSQCLGCHRDIGAHRNGQSALNPHIADIGGFGPALTNGQGPHPGFRSLEKDPGNIKFNHWLHMQPGLAVADARQKLKLSDLDESWRSQYASYAKADGLVQLDCAACHQPEAAGGAYMRPIAFEQHCRACHRLEVKLTDASPPTEVQHGLSAEQLTTVLSGLLLAAEQKQRDLSAATPDESGAIPLIPGKTMGRNLAQKITADLLGRRALVAREVTTKCLQCHQARPSQDGAIPDAPDLLPANIPNPWLKHARFDHGAHRHVECRSCHAEAFAYEQHDKPQFLSPPTGATPARDDEQVMIAGLEKCGTCHSPTWSASGSARHDCAECHKYHGREHSLSFPGSPLGTHNPEAPASSALATTALDGDSRSLRLLWKSETQNRPLPVELASFAATAPPFVGPSSCASAGCHGDVRTGGPPWKSAFTTWAAVDPHALAFEVLWTFRGREMTRLLDGRTKSDAAATEKEPLSDAEHFAVIQRRCIGCHATPAPHESTPSAEVYARGVSCESCHGPAGEWLHTHYRSGFRRDTSGFVDTKEDLNQRAKTCLKCHVGPSEEAGQPQVVDHDLIAAGHPRLAFEFHSYFESKPAHWSRLVDEARQAGAFHFRTWLAGQNEQAHQRQQLATTTPTLDFAQLDCTSCHHALSPKSWRQKSRGGIWEPVAWPSMKLPDAADPNLTWPERFKVANQVFLDPNSSSSWDSAVQAYLAVQAFLSDLKSDAGARAAEVRALDNAVTNLGRYLANDCFPTNSNDKRPPTTYDSSSEYSPAALVQRVAAVQEALQRLAATIATP